MDTPTVDQLAQKLKYDFYKLHYPNRKQPRSNNKPNKLRSNSVITIARSQTIENDITPKGSHRRAIINKNPSSLLSPDLKQQKVNFQNILNPKSQAPYNYTNKKLSINSIKDLEEMSKHNLNIRSAMQKNKDEKLKMNRIILSHKQSEEIKLQYLKNKKEEVLGNIEMEIRALYEEFFKKDYQAFYGNNGEEVYEEKFQNLLDELAKRTFL